MGGNPRIPVTVVSLATVRAERMADGRVHVYGWHPSHPDIKGSGLILPPDDILRLVRELLEARAQHLDTQAPEDSFLKPG